ncbi:hypothetical protein KPL70_024328 [Citrus sinensis]|uniref:Root cap n=1 Tax=Citrus clementina TaxID=85681 RepID=V4SBF1_CITCL|nr:uncharacterized protein LOC18034161 [Citrus x clementina]XP_024958009.1 uncharacterized protein LOC102607591 [Citrus sinensis]ESR37837.1 hypothetical protein CICLE_v10029794mg [Citrus x clementina]KAH9660861.1 hypothetical protein KPL70_024328 [Citrus sinensis]
MASRKSYILVAFFVFLMGTEAVLAANNGNNSNGNGNNDGNGNKGDDNGNGHNGKGNGNANKGDDSRKGNKDKGNGKGNKRGKDDDPHTTDYDVLTPLPSGQERHFCKGKGSACYFKTLVCPAECPGKKPKKNKRNKGCFVNCGSKCEATCKWRKPNCDGYGSLCYDPRFVGGDGVMFYFHGAKGGNFAIVSDDNLQINAHFIGTRPEGRTRDYTWVQALAVMFDTHALVIAANRVSHWDDNVDALSIRWNGKAIDIPTDGDAEWKTNADERQVLVERTDDTNNVRVKVAGLVELHIKVRPIGKEENKVHNYQLPDDDAFAHLETQFKFTNLSDLVEGVLGKTYRPDYVSPVKRGVPMPMMGGEDKYQTPSLYSPHCKACRFQRPSGFTSI